jgi:predicted RNA-binding protein with RPS1 domain
VAVGDVLEAEVTGVMPFGVFVRVVVKKGTAGKGTGGTKGTEDIKDTEGTEEIKREEGYLEGLVHISEISWEKVEDVSKLFKLGEKIKVKVLEKNLQTGKLNLSRKRLLDDPWLKVAQKYLPDKKVKGIVSRVAPFGVFVNFEPGVDGLIHISKIPAEMIFKAGDEVDCFVESVDMENRRMSLGVVLGKKPVGYK